MMNFLFATLISLLFISCTTAPIKESAQGGGAKAKWETKAVVRDLKSNKTHSIDIDVLANYPKQFRMEVSALLGTHVASFVLSGPEIKYTLFNEKKYFYGRASESSFLPLMNIPLHPVNFMNLAYDRPMLGAGWACTKGADGKLANCEQAARGLKVSWGDRSPDGQKKVVISGPSFEMRWLFRAPQTEVQFKDDTFRLDPPDEFKTIQLR